MHFADGAVSAVLSGAPLGDFPARGRGRFGFRNGREPVVIDERLAPEVAELLER